MSSRNNKSSSDDANDESVLSRFRPSNVGRGVASLISSDDTDPEPKAFARGGTKRYSASIDRAFPDENIEAFWTEYKQNPIIGTQIQSFASDVFEAGWWVTADNEKTTEEITEYCHNVGIKAGKPHRSITDLGEQAIIQHDVRGTFLGEKVTDDRGRHVAINPVNPSTIEIYTKDGINMLVGADYRPDNDDSIIKRNTDGDTAAYVQFDTRFERWNDRKERKFTRDQVLHWARRPDIGDVFGNSRVEPVLQRSQALREKLQDNDLAIAMKAWPMIMFQMGSEERPWTLDEMEDFMYDYTENEIGPGTFQGVPGDIEVNEFAGETANISEPVMTDVNMIVSAMPGPKHSTGSFPGEENSPTEAHERQYMKLVRKTRQSLQELFTPYLKEVAESWGYDPSGLQLHVGRPDNEVAPEDIQGSVIRYESDADGDGDDDSSSDPDTDGRNLEPTDDDTDDGSGADEASAPALKPSDAEELDDGGLNREYDVATLGNPDADIESYLTADDGEAESNLAAGEDELGSIIADVLIDARDNTLDVLELRHSSRTAPDGTTVQSEYDGQVGSASRSQRLVRSVKEYCEETVEDALDELSSTDHSPTIHTVRTSGHRSIGDSMAEHILDDIAGLGTRLGVEFRRQTEQISTSDHEIDAVRDRVEGAYSNAELQRRGALIAQMRTTELLNRIRLHEYRRHEDIDGVMIDADCSDDPNRLTAQLAGCSGDTAMATFDSDEPIGDQLASQVSATPTAAFNPLGDVPPYHFGDSSTIEPVMADD